MASIDQHFYDTAEAFSNAIGGMFSGSQDGVGEKTCAILLAFCGVPKEQASKLNLTDPINLSELKIPESGFYSNNISKENLIVPRTDSSTFLDTLFNMTNKETSSPRRNNIYHNVYGGTDKFGDKIPGLLNGLKKFKDMDKETQKDVLEKLDGMMQRASKEDNGSQKWLRAAYILSVHMELPGMKSIQDFHTEGKGFNASEANDGAALLFSSTSVLPRTNQGAMRKAVFDSLAKAKGELEATNINDQPTPQPTPQPVPVPPVPNNQNISTYYQFLKVGTEVQQVVEPDHSNDLYPTIDENVRNEVNNYEEDYRDIHPDVYHDIDRQDHSVSEITPDIEESRQGHKRFDDAENITAEAEIEGDSNIQITTIGTNTGRDE